MIKKIFGCTYLKEPLTMGIFRFYKPQTQNQMPKITYKIQGSTVSTEITLLNNSLSQTDQNK